MQEQGFTIVDPDSPGIAHGRGWAEFLDDIDSDGHNKGLRLAEEAPRHVAKLAKTVERLLSAGWQRVRVVTDHGWLLLPGGLPLSCRQTRDQMGTLRGSERVRGGCRCHYVTLELRARGANCVGTRHRRFQSRAGL